MCDPVPNPQPTSDFCGTNIVCGGCGCVGGMLQTNNGVVTLHDPGQKLLLHGCCQFLCPSTSCATTHCSALHIQQDPLKKSRSEDGIIAFTWWYFLHHTDQPDYLLRLPMTKVDHSTLHITRHTSHHQTRFTSPDTLHITRHTPHHQTHSTSDLT